MPSRLHIAFAAARTEKRLAFMPFVVAGYPSPAAFEATVVELAKHADVIEIGLPFSDPVADGPVIQAAFNQVLTSGLGLSDHFSSIARIRPLVNCPLVAMVSYSMVFRRGVEEFSRLAKASGIDGLILPDLSAEEAEYVVPLVRAAGLETTLLIAPSTPPERRSSIAALSSGFIYYLSVAGITGARSSLPPDLEQSLRGLRDITSSPVCIGFGISSSDHWRQLTDLRSASAPPLLDGAIVGSALIKAIGATSAPAQAASAARALCIALLGDRST